MALPAVRFAVEELVGVAAATVLVVALFATATTAVLVVAVLEVTFVQLKEGHARAAGDNDGGGDEGGISRGMENVSEFVIVVEAKVT